MDPKRSKVVYLYRDASNYKYWSKFHLSDSVDVAQIREHLLHGEYFIPGKVGVPSLTPRCMNPDDHELHEIDSVEIISGEAIGAEMSAEEFLARVQHAHREGWFS